MPTTLTSLHAGLEQLLGTGVLAADKIGPAPDLAAVAEGPSWALGIILLPLLGAVLNALCAIFGVKNKLPAWISVGSIGAAFVLVLMLLMDQGAAGRTVAVGYEWISFSWGDGPGQSFNANFGVYLDSLTIFWMLFVTGLATLIALYASEYMSHDVGTGYCRFFFAFCLFVFSMACLVMGDNLILLFLGWEGVGLCSYLLIGYFYKKPAAVAASKKAFVVNRIGDLGLLLGIFLTFAHFGTVEYRELFPLVQPYVEALKQGDLASIPFRVQLIPVLLMIGAFGKSAQLPLYVWLPDAMEGPTPVSALIHAATMVTAGVYLIARTYPLFLCSEWALPVVAWVGALTALLSATIGMAQFDIKRIMAYSTVSQLGYMFCGLAVLSSTGGAFHVLTHAFFKATLFLCCGAVMHGFAGQLDLRKLSGVAFMKGWGIVGIAMFVGCLNLAGFPFTAGYFSKDLILAESFVTGGMAPIGWILLLTAGLTAYYTFRVFFRVFVGPEHYEPGDELHDDHGEEHGADHSEDAHAHFHPHAPGWAINAVLTILAVASIAAAGLYFVGGDEYAKNWPSKMIGQSTAYQVQGDHGAAAGFLTDSLGDHGHGDEEAQAGDEATAHGSFFGYDPHKVMYYVSAVVGAIGIFIAAFLHGPKGLMGLIVGGRTEAEVSRADDLKSAIAPVAHLAERKWMVDELYGLIIVKPLLVLSHIFHLIDKMIVDGLVILAGLIPRLFGSAVRPAQSGELHGYATGMAAGIAMLIIIGIVVMAGGGIG
ncbi:MAG: NADH-quinone oxidoreductase subunit L [Planctomycetota bacterium]